MYTIASRHECLGRKSFSDLLCTMTEREFQSWEPRIWEVTLEDFSSIQRLLKRLYLLIRKKFLQRWMKFSFFLSSYFSFFSDQHSVAWIYWRNHFRFFLLRSIFKVLQKYKSQNPESWIVLWKLIWLVEILAGNFSLTWKVL